MKDELNEKIMTYFVVLLAKMYAYRKIGKKWKISAEKAQKTV